MNWSSDEWQSLLDAEESGSADSAEDQTETGDSRSFSRLLLSALFVLAIALVTIGGMK
jgi:hypothetical protein